jgi:hypothetical protein
MARKKPAKKAKKKAGKATTKTSARKPMKKKKAAPKAAKKASKKAAPKRAARPAPKAAKRAAARPSSARASAGKPKGRLIAAVKKVAVAAVVAGVNAALAPQKKRPNLDRPRKTVADVHGIPSSLDVNRGASAAKSGRAELKDRLARNTGAGPALTSGDVDADWESAEAIGDEAPGGDNPTPDQDVVDDIGRALGVEYEDDEELQGGAEIADRDRNRWELDPSSKDDFDEEE